MSDVIMSNIQIWREKARQGTLTPEEMREAIAAIRRERNNASAVSAASKERKAKAAAASAPIDSDSLLDGLMQS